MDHSTPLRQAITQAIRRPEPVAVQALLSQARQSKSVATQTDTLAKKLIQGMRDGSGRTGRAGRVQSLMQEYALSSNEGIALMCLAEALLRIPDAATRDALIRDKVKDGNWLRHAGQSDSLFVNAASWGLVLTGKLMSSHDEHELMSALTRLVGKQGEPLIRKGMQFAMQMLGEQFVTGQTIHEALSRSQSMEAKGFRYSYDMLGEAAMTRQDAQRYFNAYEEAIHAIGQSAQGKGVQDGAGISIKLSALHPRYCRAQVQRVKTELIPQVLKLAQLAKQYNMGLNIDAEESERLDISLDILEALCFAPELSGWDGMGFVIQAYQKRCPFVIDYLIDLAQRANHRLMIRLVKGAYWDSEIKRAQVEGQIDYPVFTQKHHTDVSYLACARKLLGAIDKVFPQFATHNAHTVASIVSIAEDVCGKYQIGHYEFQCLHGMGEPLYLQVVGPAQLNRPCRIYAPVGTHETLLAYLVRRLLENGANSSFVNRMADASVSIESLVQDPVVLTENEANRLHVAPGQPNAHIPMPKNLYGTERLNSNGWDLNHGPTLARIQHYIENTPLQIQVKPLLADTVEGAQIDTVVNPAKHSHILGSLQHASSRDIETALQEADAFASTWAQTLPHKRAEALEQTAALLESESLKCLHLLIHEAGKTWAHAVAEIRESVDFLRYYALQIRQEFSNATHHPLGPVVCISPWNFPLAIFIGQISAALAAGNTVLAKPAEQTSGIAALAVQLMWQAGVPRSALQLLPGTGLSVGNALVSDSRVQGVLFTGSTQTAQKLNQVLSKRMNRHGQVVPLIAETGGLNCMVVDSSALLEQVIGDALTSAFEAAGQRCSALRILCIQDEVADPAIEMLKGGMAELTMGHPALLETDVGPVIDLKALEKIESHVRELEGMGRRVHRLQHRHENDLTGTYVAPTIIEIESIQDAPNEIFGPVLHVLRYARTDLDQLLLDINATGYALTFGVHSRIDEAVQKMTQTVHAGNVYVNRNMVGAVVGVQAFGGDGLSGTGPKAGGPLYLLRLLSACPDDAALRSVQSVGGSTLPPTAKALEALYSWALSNHRTQLAQMCARFSACNPAGLVAEMKGPTGETNQYFVNPRPHVLCNIGTQASWEDDLLIQLAAVAAVGSKAIVLKDLQSFVSTLPMAVQDIISFTTRDQLPKTQTVLMHGSTEEILNFSLSLSQREGPLASLIGLQPGTLDLPLSRLVQERSISVNTTAAGGNASLMSSVS